jgi:hypothetical protein
MIYILIAIAISLVILALTIVEEAIHARYNVGTKFARTLPVKITAIWLFAITILLIAVIICDANNIICVKI